MLLQGGRKICGGVQGRERKQNAMSMLVPQQEDRLMGSEEQVCLRGVTDDAVADAMRRWACGGMLHVFYRGKDLSRNYGVFSLSALRVFASDASVEIVGFDIVPPKDAMDAALKNPLSPVDVLKKLLRWDHFNGAADGPYWRRMILASLARYGADQETERVCREEFERGEYITSEELLKQLRAELDAELAAKQKVRGVT